MDDETLLELSLRDPELSADFYGHHAAGVLRYFANRTFDADTASDLTAETFAEALASRHRFRKEAGSASGWLYTIARRQLSKFIKKGQVEDRARRRLGIPRIPLAPDDYERIEELIDFERIGEAVAKALSLLSKEQREALTLRVIDERPYSEVAGLLRCTEQAARARVSRGLERLATLIDV